MIKSPDRIREAEAAWSRSLYVSMDYHEALKRYAALWSQARLLSTGFSESWEDDIKADIELARILNGLPPTA